MKSKDIGTVSEKCESSTYFIRQTIGNACGTVALVHALANNKDDIQFDGKLEIKSSLSVACWKVPVVQAKMDISGLLAQH